jgi:hypothetical protein
MGADRARAAILRKIPDHQGSRCITEERLFSYLQQFERDFHRAVLLGAAADDRSRTMPG